MGRGKLKNSMKHSKNFSELFGEEDNRFSQKWMKCDNGKSLEKLTISEREELWLSIIQNLKKYSMNETQENIHKLSNMLELIHYIMSNSDFKIDPASELINLLMYINCNDFDQLDESLKNNVSLINELWLTKRSENMIPNMEYFTLKHLLSLCSSDKPLISDIQRLNSIRKFITTAPFETAVPSLRPQVIKLVQSQVVLNSDHGQRFLSQVMILSQRIMLDIHKTVMLELSSCNKKKTMSYARMYVMAWQNAKGGIRNVLEKTCFQHIMESFLKEQRTSLELSKMGQNVLFVLEQWHSERKKKNVDFVTMITDCYQPFIWKYLESGFNVHRCNAVDLLFKAFPLQRPGENVMESERLFNQQFDAMVSALRDDCHIVRIVAVREVCNILSHYWNSFTPVQIHKFLTIISKEDAHDSSTADVRRMVYIGFQSFVENPLAFDYLRQILPSMADNIHDMNQKVRTAFIQLLIAVKEKEDPNVKFSDLVPTFSLHYRLAEESIKVGQLIVKLLLSSYYRESMPTVEWTKRFIFLIKTYPRAYRNFFLYSEKSLPFQNAFTILNEILIQVGMYVMSKSNVDGDDAENEEIFERNVKRFKSGRNKKPLGTSNIGKNNEIASREEKVKTRQCAFDDPVVVEGLFDIVSILWVLHDNKLNKQENQDKRIKLYETYIKYAQPFINYYKDTGLFISVLSLSGNIPSSLLRSNSITLPGYCMKMLKSNKFDSSATGKGNIPSLLVALIKWGKGGDVLEQVALWLDAAFETQSLNDTILPLRKVKISETIQPNSIVAINILDTLMKTDYVRVSILKKNYAQLYELWKFMSRIKKLIEARLAQGEPYEDDLVSDEFIKLCFKRYIKLIPLLKDIKNNNEGEEETGDEKDLTVNYQQEIEDLMQWAEEVLFRHLQDKHQFVEPQDISLITSIYSDILYVADNMIILHTVNRQFYSKISLLTLKLLETPYNLHFVKSASRVAAAVNFSGKSLFCVNDDLKIFSKMIPYIVSNVLNVLTCKKMSDEEILLIDPNAFGFLEETCKAKHGIRIFPCQQGKRRILLDHLHKGMMVMGDVKANLSKILETYQDNFKLKINSREAVRQLQMIISIFLDAVITVLSKSIMPETLHLQLYANLSQFPAIVNSLISLFFNKKFWSSMFVHVLNGTLAGKIYDSKSVLASVVVLHFYANNDKKLNKTELEKAISTTKGLLSKAKLENLREVQNSSAENNGCPGSGFVGNRMEDSRSSGMVEPNTFTDEKPSALDCEKYLSEGLIDEGLFVLSQLEGLLSKTMGEEE